MLREIDLAEVSDGKLYTARDRSGGSFRRKAVYGQRYGKGRLRRLPRML